ncbi:MAG: hypothetical protein AB8G05_24250 [Oligoflexales bacterium]
MKLLKRMVMSLTPYLNYIIERLPNYESIADYEALLLKGVFFSWFVS